LTIGGDVTIGSGATFAGASFSHNVAGNWTTNGTFSAGTGTVTFTGSAVAVGGSGTTACNNLTSSGTVTLGNTVTAGGNLTVSAGTFDLSSFSADRTASGGTLTVASGATLRIGATGSFPGNYSTSTLFAS